MLSIGSLNELEVNLYPNPVSNKLNIELASLIETSIVTNIVGAIVYKTSVTTNSETFILDFSSYPNGAYVIGIETNDGMAQKRVMKR